MVYDSQERLSGGLEEPDVLTYRKDYMTAGKTATIWEDMQVDKARDLKSLTFGLGARVAT